MLKGSPQTQSLSLLTGTRLNPYGEARIQALPPSKVGVVLRDFDVDDFGITRTQAAQFMAYGAGIARIIEPLLPLVIGRVSSDGPAVCSRKRWLAGAGTGSDRDTLAAAARAPAQRLHARSSIIPWPDYSAPVSFLAPTRRSVTNERWNFRKRLEEQRRGAMSYCITLRSRTNETITGCYAGRKTR
jgi:hypothetical protein